MVLSFERAKRIAINGSPQFRKSVGALVASGSVVIGLENDEQGERKYLPMDTLIIKNTSTSDIEIRAGTQVTVVVGNTASTLSDAIGFNSIHILNLDGSNAIAADAIILVFNKAPLSEDEKIRRQSFGTLFPERSIFQTIGR